MTASRFALCMVFSSAFAGVLSPACRGQHAGDILVEPVGGVISTGRVVPGESGPVVERGVRVFAAEFGEFPNFTDEPGFDTTGGAGFPNETVLAFDILDAVRRWDGTGFDEIPAETIRVSKATTNVTSPLLANQVRAGFSFGQVGSGFLHEHLRYFLNVPHGAGVYLLQMRLRTPGSGYADSPAFWVVFNQNESEAVHDAAVAYMERLVEQQCFGDVNGDSAVNTGDLTVLLSRFGQSVLRYDHGDLTGNTVVDTADLVLLLNRFGAVCP